MSVEGLSTDVCFLTIIASPSSSSSSSSFAGLEDNDEGQVNNMINDTLDATDNWWGSKDGPTGNDVVGMVDFDPFLTKRPKECGARGLSSPPVKRPGS